MKMRSFPLIQTNRSMICFRVGESCVFINYAIHTCPLEEEGLMNTADDKIQWRAEKRENWLSQYWSNTVDWRTKKRVMKLEMIYSVSPYFSNLQYLHWKTYVTFMSIGVKIKKKCIQHRVTQISINFTLCVYD